MTAVYGHCSNIIDTCKSYKNISNFSRVDLVPIAKREGVSSLQLDHQMFLQCWSLFLQPWHSLLGNSCPEWFLGSASIFSWNSFHLKQAHTLPVQHTAGHVLGPVCALQQCLSRHRSYLNDTTFQETQARQFLKLCFEEPRTSSLHCEQLFLLPSSKLLRSVCAPHECSPDWTSRMSKLKSRDQAVKCWIPSAGWGRLLSLESRTKVFPWYHGGWILHRPWGFTKDLTNFSVAL